jgi:hypothetical protein
VLQHPITNLHHITENASALSRTSNNERQMSSRLMQSRVRILNQFDMENDIDQLEIGLWKAAMQKTNPVLPCLLACLSHKFIRRDSLAMDSSVHR